MDSEDPKKYRILENILQKVNQKYVALPDDETKRNNKLLQVIDRIIQKLRSKSVLFNNLYQNKFYGGSYYDGLKVGNPSEYDLDCLLTLPKVAEPTVEVSDRPGYVHIVLNMKALEKKVDEAPKYVGLDKLLDGNRLSSKKVKSWMEGLMASALTGGTEIELEIDDTKIIAKAKVIKSGPAMTIMLEGHYDGKDFNMDIDLVPCFTFFEDQWPKEGYRSNAAKKKTFFVVPKSPSDADAEYWRLSFQEQERELISGYAVMKPTIRLIKKIRDRHQHCIASYFIKTVFLWELEKCDKSLWQNSLSFVFVTMMRKYAEYIEQRKIPYYWNGDNNLIADLSEITASCISNKFKNIVDHIERICNTKSDIFGIVQYFLTPDEVDLEEFKKEVPLSKKLLKHMESQQILQALPTVIVNPEPTLSSRSSVASSFEEISKDMLNEASSTSSAELSQTMLKLEIACLALSSEQKRIFGMLETAIDKIESCENQIQRLVKEEEKRKCEEVVHRNELARVLAGIDNKLERLLKKEEASTKPDPVDLFLGETDRLKSNLDFARL